MPKRKAEAVAEAAERAVEKSGAQEVGVYVNVNGQETLIRSYKPEDSTPGGPDFVQKAEGFAKKQTDKPNSKPHYCKKIR